MLSATGLTGLFGIGSMFSAAGASRHTSRARRSASGPLMTVSPFKVERRHGAFRYSSEFQR